MYGKKTNWSSLLLKKSSVKTLMGRYYCLACYLFKSVQYEIWYLEFYACETHIYTMSCQLTGHRSDKRAGLFCELYSVGADVCPDNSWFTKPWIKAYIIMTSSNGNIFRVTGHLCGELTCLHWFPRTKASGAELWCFLWFAPEWTLE